MTLDIRRNVLVVWVRVGKRRVIQMRLGVIPGYLFCSAPQLVAIEFDFDEAGVKRQSFLDSQAIPVRESHLAL